MTKALLRHAEAHVSRVLMTPSTRIDASAFHGLDLETLKRLKVRNGEVWTPCENRGSHLAQAIGHAAIQQGHQVIYREAHALL
jgi:hypothetical protein